MTDLPLIVAALRAAGFAPYLWETNETEFVKQINGCEVYVQTAPRGVVSVTRTQDNTRLLTTYFHGMEEFLVEGGLGLGLAHSQTHAE